MLKRGPEVCVLKSGMTIASYTERDPCVVLLMKSMFEIGMRPPCFARFASELKRDPRVAVRPAFEVGTQPSLLQGLHLSFGNVTFVFDKGREVRV